MNGPGISLSKAEVLGQADKKEDAFSDHLALVATFELPSQIAAGSSSTPKGTSSHKNDSGGTSIIGVFFIILGVLLTFSAFIAVTHPKNRGKMKLLVSKFLGRDNAMALPTSNHVGMSPKFA